MESDDNLNIPGRGETTHVSVIDKDMTAALLGRIIKAQELFIITDVDNIYLNFKTESQEIIPVHSL